MSRLVGACRRFVSWLSALIFSGDIRRDRSRFVATGRTSSIYAMCFITEARVIRNFSPNGVSMRR
jgi:hypothetical protein